MGRPNLEYSLAVSRELAATLYKRANSIITPATDRYQTKSVTRHLRHYLMELV